MKISINLFLIGIIIPLSGFALDNNKINEVLNLSGFNKQKDSLARDLQTSLNSILPQIKNEKDRELQSTINQVIFKSINESIKKTDFKSVLSSNINDNELNELHRWYKSGFAKRIAKLDIEEQKKGIIGLEEFALNLKKNPPQKERSLYIGSIAKESGSIEFNIEIQQIMATGVALRINNSKPAKDKKKVIDILKEVEFNAQKNYVNIVTLVVLQFFRMYESLSTQELKQYSQFIKSGPGKKSNMALQTSFINIFREVSNEIAYSSSRKTASEN